MSLQLRSTIENNQSGLIYYDIELYNKNSGNNTNAVELKYSEPRITPFLGCPSNYDLSVVRFSLDNTSTPVFMPSIRLGQSDPNLTEYQISMIYGASTAIQYINYVPSNLTLSVQPPLIEQDLNNEYYFVYEYQQWVDMINTTFQNLATTLALAETPFIEFVADTSLLVFYVPFSYIALNVHIYINDMLQSLFASIPYNFVRTNNPAIGKMGFAYELIYKNRVINHFSIGAVEYVASYQESNTLSILNPVSTIVFESALLPVNKSLIGTPIIYTTGNQQIQTGNNGNFTLEITDFKVNLSNASTYRNNILYEPTAEYRFLSMTGNTPCTDISINVYWKSKQGKKRPFLLNCACGASIKILFRRRDFFSQNLPHILPN